MITEKKSESSSIRTFYGSVHAVFELCIMNFYIFSHDIGCEQILVNFGFFLYNKTHYKTQVDKDINKDNENLCYVLTAILCIFLHKKQRPFEFYNGFIKSLFNFCDIEIPALLENGNLKCIFFVSYVMSSNLHSAFTMTEFSKIGDECSKEDRPICSNTLFFSTLFVFTGYVAFMTSKTSLDVHQLKMLQFAMVLFSYYSCSIYNALETDITPSYFVLFVRPIINAAALVASIERPIIGCLISMASNKLLDIVDVGS